jgi:hypothetical protein
MHDAIAREILDGNSYATLATADADGLPWASPVWFAHDGYRELVWVSSPEARHSRNLAVRPQLAIVVFDSQAAVGAGQAVYMEAVAEEPAGDALAHGIRIFTGRSERDGLRRWSVDDVSPPALHRLYRATVSQHWILDPDAGRDVRIPVSP